MYRKIKQQNKPQQKIEEEKNRKGCLVRNSLFYTLYG